MLTADCWLWLLTADCRLQGVLVRTGVYKEGDDINGASTVVAGIGEAVDWILSEEARIRGK